jgi:hypothetical protein
MRLKRQAIAGWFAPTDSKQLIAGLGLCKSVLKLEGHPRAFDS